MIPFIRFSVVLRTTVLLLDYGTNGSAFSIRSLETRPHPMLIRYAGVGAEDVHGLPWHMCQRFREDAGHSLGDLLIFGSCGSGNDWVSYHSKRHPPR